VPSKPTIPDDVFAYFASNPIGATIEVPRVLNGADTPVARSLNRYLAGLSEDLIAETLSDRRFLFFHSGAPDLVVAAKAWWVGYELMAEIDRRRANILCAAPPNQQPPYGTHALLHADVDSEGLVALKQFTRDGARLLRQHYAFTVLCITPSPNSTYWLLQAIYDAGIHEVTRVRLDPFLHGPEGQFPSIFYRMDVFGRALQWDRIAALTEPEYGRWAPDTHGESAGFTDYVWEPRSNEVHLQIEEVRPLDNHALSAARYLHAVYSPTQDRLIHLDGALRLYNGEELERRRATHVRKTGKVAITDWVVPTSFAS
jgi:hypothetical protein